MPERKINLEEILTKVFEPSPQDCSTPSQDLQLAVTLNPDISRIKEAMKEACRQTLELAAEKAKLYFTDLEQTEVDIDKQSILNTINQIE